MEEKAKNSKKKSGVKSFIGGTILTDDRVTRQLPFILFLAAMGILLITNRNWAERTIRQVEVIQDTLDDLRSESITLSAKLMDASRPSEVLKKVKKAGVDLQEPIAPLKKLYVDKD
jgi:hypothetical protein